MRYSASIIVCIISVQLFAKEPIASIDALAQTLYQSITGESSFELCQNSYTTLQEHPEISATQLHAITAHALARAYHELVILIKHDHTISMQRKYHLILLCVSAYLAGGIIANRVFKVGLGKPAAWIWFPIAKMYASGSDDNKKSESLGLGAFWIQYIAAIGFTLYGICYSIPILITAHRSLRMTGQKKSNLTHIITYLEGIYYAPHQ